MFSYPVIGNLTSETDLAINSEIFPMEDCNISPEILNCAYKLVLQPTFFKS